MFHWRRRGLEAKFLFSMVVLIVLIVGAVYSVENHIAIQLLEHDLLEGARECARGVAAEVEKGLPPTNDLLRLLSVYEGGNHDLYDIAVFRPMSEAGFSRVASLRATTRSGEEHALALRNDEPVERIVEIGGQRLWSIALPVSVKGGQEHTLIGVWMSLHSVEVLRQRSRNLLLVTVPVSVVLLAIVIHFVFRYLVHRPLRALGTTMIAVESGDLSAVIPVVDTDEIGVISARFNRMVGHLKETVEDREALLTRVDGFNRKLEEKVEEATQALEEKNLQLQRVNSELYYLQRRLARSQRLTLAGKVTATFAHKLGTPLNLISGYIQTVLRQRHDENAVQEKLRAIHAQVDRLTGFIQNMLDETRTPLLDLKPLRLDTLLERILAAIEPALQSHAVHVEKKLGTELRSVMGDEGQLEQVFSNLVNNSLDAMPNGGTLTISTEQIDDMVRVRVSDTGEGISEAELPQIFRPLFTTKEIGRGTGLGLAIVKEILVAHGASIRVESQVDRGTTFILEFPLPVESREVMAHA